MRHARDTNSADSEPQDAWPIDPQNSLLLLETAFAHAQVRQTRNKPFLRLELREGDWQQIINSARAGVRKGQGRKGRKNDRYDDLVWDAVIAFAHRAKARHRKTLKVTGANSAEDLAAEDARVYASERFGKSVAVNTIKRKMQSRR